MKHASEIGDRADADGADITEVAHMRTNKRTGENLYTKVRAIVEPVGGIELELPPRSSVRPVPFLGREYEAEDIDNS